MSDETHLALHPVRSDRTAEFERFLTDVVVPAVDAQRPELARRWRLMRSTEPRDGITTYVFLFEGGSVTDDWELDRLLPAHYGEEEAERIAHEWLDTFAPLGTWAEAVVAAGQETNQALWTLEPVSLR